MSQGFRFSRRSVLTLGGAALVGAAVPQVWAEPQEADRPTAVAVRAAPLTSFSLGERDRRAFGALTFRSGLELHSSDSRFGGFSGLWRSLDGRVLVALTDRGHWLTATVILADGRLAGLAQTAMAPILGTRGRPLRRTRSYDTEALAIADGVAYVGIERSHEVMRFDWARDGFRARGRAIPVPAEVKALPRNKGLEAVGIAPRGHPLAGAVVAIAEQARPEEDAPTRGFILSGPRRGAFDVIRSRGYDVTDLAFLPSGAMLLLERHYSLLRGAAVRIRRIAPEALAPGAAVDGPVLFEADAGHQVDNMEGMAISRDESGQTIVTLISDDNFSALQRTLLLEFALAED